MRLTETRRSVAVSAFLVLMLGLVSMLVRPLIPVDETRYISVAWGMWSADSWWVPIKNYAPYVHKPPLLFWLIHLGWSVLGVNEWWPRMLNPILVAIDLWLIAGVARLLWPARPEVPAYAPMIYLGSWYVLALSTALMFDALMTLSVLTAVFGLLRADDGGRAGWALFALGIALGLLAKGPVVLVYTLPVALAFPWWSRSTAPRAPRYMRIAQYALLGCVPVAVWLAMVVQHAGWEEVRALVVDQSLMRIKGEIGHGRPLWWYLPWLLLLPMPWLLWPELWRALAAAILPWPSERGLRFSVIAAVSSIALLSLVGGKQVHYLLPVWALAAPMFARAVAQIDPLRHGGIGPMLWAIGLFIALPWFPLTIRDPDVAATFSELRPSLTMAVAGVGIVVWLAARRFQTLPIVLLASVSLVATVFVCTFPALRPAYDLSTAAGLISQAQAEGRPVAFVGHYQDEFGFLGRLRWPVSSLDPAESARWARQHPNGILIGRSKRIRVNGTDVEYRERYRSGELIIVSADKAAAGRVEFVDPLREYADARDAKSISREDRELLAQ